MRKVGAKRTRLIIVSFTLLITLFLSVAAYASNASPPRVHTYGFAYTDINTWNEHPSFVYGWRGNGYYDNASGAYNLLDYNNPSIHEGLADSGWASWPYLNENAACAANWMPGDAMFFFFGHAEAQGSQYSRKLKFIKNGTYSYLADIHRSGDSGSNIYVQDIGDLDDMAFAYLAGCSTMAAAPDGASLAWAFRCLKGVDSVLAFGSDWYFKYGNMYPGFTFNECFMRSACLEGVTVGDAKGIAVGMQWEYYRNYYGLNSADIWGSQSTYIDYPHNGIIGQ